MSHGLAPSKSTVYVSNLPFSLTNNDLHKIFAKYGDVGKVTILKDKITRNSRGVAFVLFLKRDDAYQAVRALNQTEMFGRTLKCSIAKDNGRAPEFIRRKVYPDKSSCYECGESGHLSYECPKNLLGDRNRPEKKKKKRKKGEADSDSSDSDEPSVSQPPKVKVKVEAEDEVIEKKEEAIEKDDVIAEQRHQIEEQIKLMQYDEVQEEPKRKHYKKDSYFSDEESLSE